MVNVTRGVGKCVNEQTLSAVSFEENEGCTTVTITNLQALPVEI